MDHAGTALESGSDSLRDNATPAAAALGQDAYALEHVSERLRAKKSIVLQAVERNWGALSFVSYSLRVTAMWHATIVAEDLQRIGCRLRDNATLAAAALGQDAYALEIVGERLRAKKSIVVTAVERKWAEHRFLISYSLRDVSTFAATVVAEDLGRQNAFDLRYASARLCANELIVLKAVEEDGNMLSRASASLRDNETVVTAAVKQQARSLQYASRSMQDNEEVVRAAVEQDGFALRHASERLRANKSIVLEAVKQDQSGLAHVSISSPSLRADEDVIRAVAARQLALCHKCGTA